MIDYVYNVEMGMGNLLMSNMSSLSFWNEVKYWDTYGPGAHQIVYWRPVTKIRILAVVKPEGWT